MAFRLGFMDIITEILVAVKLTRKVIFEATKETKIFFLLNR
jgi:hypothetical protein